MSVRRLVGNRLFVRAVTKGQWHLARIIVRRGRQWSCGDPSAPLVSYQQRAGGRAGFAGRARPGGPSPPAPSPRARERGTVSAAGRPPDALTIDDAADRRQNPAGRRRRSGVEVCAAAPIGPPPKQVAGTQARLAPKSPQQSGAGMQTACWPRAKEHWSSLSQSAQKPEDGRADGDVRDRGDAEAQAKGRVTGGRVIVAELRVGRASDAWRPGSQRRPARTRSRRRRSEAVAVGQVVAGDGADVTWGGCRQQPGAILEQR